MVRDDEKRCDECGEVLVEEIYGYICENCTSESSRERDEE